MSKLKCFNCGTNGHGVRECPDISCHYCHDRGHIVDNCPKKRHRSPNHSDTDSLDGRYTTTANTNTSTYTTVVPSLRGNGAIADSDKCYTCKEYGHRSEACAMTVCHECGRKGHIAKICPSKRDHREDKKCYFCKRKGHQIAECELKRQYPNEEKLCYMCLKPGHHANECHNAAVCHMCGRDGHISNDCPTRECANCHTYGHSVGKCPSVRCFRCNENGHMANECADEVNANSSGTPAAATASSHQHQHNNTMNTQQQHQQPLSVHQHAAPTPSPAAAAGASSYATVGSTVSPQPTHALPPPPPPHHQYYQAGHPPPQYASQQQQHAYQPQMVASPIATVLPQHHASPPVVQPPPHHPAAAAASQQQSVAAPSPLQSIPPLDESLPRPSATNGRVCVLIDGSYFEASVRQAAEQQQHAGGGINYAAEYSRIRLALQHTLHLIGTIFDKTPYGFWFDMDPSSLAEFVEQEFNPVQKEAAMRRLQAKHAELITHMCGGRGLSNVVTRLVGKIRHRPIVNALGYGSSWMPAGVDVAIATSVVECFESKQFSQVVLLSGDGALCPAVDYCNAKRQTAMHDQPVKAPVRVAGCMNTMDALFGSRQELVDFLPRIFLDAPEHVEEGKRVPFPTYFAFK